MSTNGFDRTGGIVPPRPLHRLINERTWSRITDNTSSRLRLTDWEETNFSLTIPNAQLLETTRNDHGMTPKCGHGGITAPGDYAEYAREPSRWIYAGA